MTRVYDSRSDIEDTHARLRPEIFNADIKINHIIHETADHRSDNKARVVTEIYRIILHILPKSVHNPFNDYRPILFFAQRKSMYTQCCWRSFANNSKPSKHLFKVC